MWRVGVVALCLTAACYKAPMTGRRQLILLPQEFGARLGRLAFIEILNGERTVRDRRYGRIVTRIGEDIVAASGSQEQSWEYAVLAGDDTANAFALPGGIVGVYTGMFSVARSEAGLATVLGHEVAHVIARHGAERMSQSILLELGASAIVAGMRNHDPAVVEAVLGAYAIGGTVAAILPFSRQHEAEADRIGLVLMAKAGYDPREAIAFWQRMQGASASATAPEFLSTHPSHQTRIVQLSQWMPEAMLYYEAKSSPPQSPSPHEVQ